MKYLFQLLNSLTDEEWRRIDRIALSDAESVVFEYIRNQNSNHLPAIPDAARTLNMTDGHFRKACSSILQKFFQELVPKGGFMLIQYLSNRTLHSLAKHELIKYEKQLLKEKDTEALASLYYLSVEKFLNAELTQYDEDFMLSLVEKFKEIKPDAPDHEVLILYLQIEKMRISMCHSKHVKSEASFKQIMREIGERMEDYRTQLKGISDPMANYWLHNVTYNFIELFTPNMEGELQHLKAMVKLYDDNPGAFNSDKYRLNPASSIGLCYYYHSDFEEAFYWLNDVIQNNEEAMKGGLYYVDMYVQLCIALGKYQLAEDTLFKYYPYNREKPYEYNGIHFGALAVLSIINLLREDYEMAFQLLQTAKRLCAKSTFFWLDALIRMVENAYFFLEGNYDLADELVTKNLKFYQYRGNGEDIESLKKYHLIIRALIKQANAMGKKESTSALPNDLEAYYEDWQKAEFAFIGKLLQKMRQKTDLVTA